MGSVVRSCFVIVVFVFCVAQIGQGGQLDVNYYIKTCPQVQKIVASELQKAFKSDPRSAASLLKLHFSDCFVNGCDASVLLDDTKDFKGEKNATPSYKSSARGFEVIDNIKSEVEKACPSVVSCADILTLAAKESVGVVSFHNPSIFHVLLDFIYLVFQSGGPSWEVPLGRRDGKSTSDKAADEELPVPSEPLITTYNKFKSKGLSVTDAVVLSASHSIGFARCATFKNRLFNYKNSGKPDAKMNPKLLKLLQASCPDASTDNKPCPMNLPSSTSSTKNIFGIAYYNNLLNNNTVLESDTGIMTDRFAATLVTDYSKNQGGKFFKEFAASMIKLGNVGVITFPDGEIRKKCGAINQVKT